MDYSTLKGHVLGPSTALAQRVLGIKVPNNNNFFDISFWQEK
jgi:hypothetical protein